jgi:hypothetical protein
MARPIQSSAVVRSLVLVLCAALFAWGLHGKLSRYHAPNQSHPKSAIKLIQTDPKDPTRQFTASAPVAARSPFLGSPDLAAAYSHPRWIVDKIQQARKPAPRSAPSHTYALQFRPPPASIYRLRPSVSK